MKNRKAPILLIAFLSIILLGMPIMLIPVLFIGLYIRWFKAGDFTPLLNRLERIDSTKLFIACGFTLISLVIYQSLNYVAYLGFPLPFINYYNFPVTGQTLPLWNKWSVNGLAAGLNILSYYLLLSLMQWLYRQGALWRENSLG